MNYKYEIVVGVGFDKNKNVINHYNIDDILKSIAIEFGGYSLIKQSGGYIMNSDGTLIKEDSLNISILTQDNSNETTLFIKIIANNLKVFLNQESVLVVLTEIIADFV